MIKKENYFMLFLAAVVILLAVFLGNLFAAKNSTLKNQNGTSVTQIKNDDVSSIEKDLNTLNFANMDKELSNIDKELVGF